MSRVQDDTLYKAEAQVIITAFPEESIRRRAMAAGASGFFSKPFNAGELVSCIERALAAPTVADTVAPDRQHDKDPS